jgi:hypothetical protein
MKINGKWFSEQKGTVDNSNNPWVGLASYEDPETAGRKVLFCGRDDESYDVSKLIMSNIFVTLYGKSGIGKTSLLNAGVFPELREEQYTPISLRLGIRDEKEKKSFQEIIIEEIERKVCKVSVVDVVEEQSNLSAMDFLWNYFARHRFYDKNDDLTSPVIVFDQFEEVFRDKKGEAEILLRQIDYINDKDHSIDTCTISGQPYRYETNFRFVVSIREDDLYRLEDSIDNCYLPALKRCRYRLHSLSPENASAAILIPGESFFPSNEQERKEIVDKIIDYVSDKDRKNISTNILSLICSQLYQSIQTQHIQTVNASILESFFHDNPIDKFYMEAISKLSRKERKYIETNLIDSAGRRNSVSYNDFDTYIKHKETIINSPLAILHELNVSSGDDGARVELIHDKLAEVISKRKKNEESKLNYLLSFLTAIILLVAIILLFFILQNRKKEYIVEFQEDESISLTDYWKANICILDKSDTVMVGTFDKSTTKVPFLYGKSGPLQCHVNFLVGDIADINSTLSLKDTTYFFIPISRAAQRKRYEGVVIESVQRSPIVDAIVIIGEQIKRTDKLGRFVIYSDSTAVESDGKIRILRDGYKLYENYIGNSKIFTLELNDYKDFRNKWNSLEKKLNRLNLSHYSGVIDDIVKSTMYLGIEKDSVFGYFYIDKFFDPKAKNKYLRYILLDGKIDAAKQTFVMNSTDAVLNKCIYYGSFAEDEWVGTSRSYGNRTWTFSFHSVDEENNK